MDKLEHYLDQVCRGIAGPRALRQHIRLELREHIRDAAAEHQSAGMSSEEALARALEDFGGPDQVRAELEATHGHRLLAVVLDKALQWKEKTMKAKWIWSTWAHVMLVLAIALELCFLYGCMIFIVPKFRELQKDGWIDTAGASGAAEVCQWSVNTLVWILSVMQYDLWLALLAAGLWALFEWRVRSENKTPMRLAGLGTLAVGLLMPAFLAAAALILPLILLAHPVYHADRAHEIARQQIVILDDALKSIDAPVAAGNWDQAFDRFMAIDRAFLMVGNTGGHSVWETEDDLAHWKSQMRAGEAALREARAAYEARDPARFAAALQTFRQMYAAMHPAAPPK